MLQFIVSTLSLLQAVSGQMAQGQGQGRDFSRLQPPLSDRDFGHYPLPQEPPPRPPPLNLYKKCHPKGLSISGQDDGFVKAQACLDLYLTIGVLQDIIQAPEPGHFFAPPDSNQLVKEAIQICPVFRRLASSTVANANYEDVCCDRVCYCNEAENNGTSASGQEICGGQLSLPAPPMQGFPPPMTGFVPPQYNGRFSPDHGAMGPGQFGPQANVDEMMYRPRDGPPRQPPQFF